MNTLVSPSQVFCEKCQQMVKTLLNAVEKQQNKLEEDEMYEKTIDFLRSNLYLLRDMKMIAGFAYLIWILVDFRIYDNSFEKRKQITKELEDIIETILELAENEDIMLCTSVRRMQIYFSMAAVYSKLKPVANVILIEQCYLEAESIVKFVNEIPATEKKQILDLWETIKTSHELRNIHSVVKKEHCNNHITVNYISSDPFEGGSLYAPSLKRKETPEISHEPRRRRRRRYHKKMEKTEIENDDLIPAISVDTNLQNEEKATENGLPQIEKHESLEKVNETQSVKNEIESSKYEQDKIGENREINEVEIIPNEQQEESSDEEKTYDKNEHEESEIEENDEPPEIPKSEPPELNYEPSPYSYITNSSLRNPPLFHPIMLPRDPTKGILPPLKIDPPTPRSTTNDIPVIVKNVIAELNEKNGANIRPFERTVKPITNLERTTFSLKEIDFD